MLQTLNRESFRQVVLEGTGTVVVDYYTTRCPHCPPLLKTLEQLAPAYPDVTFAKVDAGHEQDLARGANLEGVPTLVIYKAGREVTRLLGAQPAQTVRQALDTVA